MTRTTATCGLMLAGLLVVALCSGGPARAGDPGVAAYRFEQEGSTVRVLLNTDFPVRAGNVCLAVTATAFNVSNVRRGVALDAAGYVLDHCETCVVVSSTGDVVPGALVVGWMPETLDPFGTAPLPAGEHEVLRFDIGGNPGCCGSASFIEGVAARQPGDAGVPSPSLLQGNKVTDDLGNTVVASADAPLDVCSPALFVRSDSNADGHIDVSDPIKTLLCLFLGQECRCAAASDADDSGTVDTTDVIYTLSLIYRGGSSPPAPFPGCGSDLTSDGLTCESYPPCGTSAESCPPPPAPPSAAPALAGFTFVLYNNEGYPVYSHEGTDICFVLLPGGDFEMGSPDTEPNRIAEEGPVHTVTLSPFLMAKYECTQEEYAAVMAGHATLSATPSFNQGLAPADPRRPVEGVPWRDLQDVDGFLARTGLSLPTEAQWEYAARGGTVTAFSWGDACNQANCDACATADDHMWHCGNADESTHPVGEKLPNPFGLHDMHGNVRESCEDVYSTTFYGTAAAAGPDPVSTAGSQNRVHRGGSYGRWAKYGRSADRTGSLEAHRLPILGFRLAAPAVLLGCTNPAATNYDPGADVDDGSCVFHPVIEGFTFVETNAVSGLHEYTQDQTGIRFVRLPGGDFEMGSPDTEPNRGIDEGPVHTVTLSPFLMAKYEVTQAEYEAVMGTNPSHFRGDVLPVERVSWDDLKAADGFLARTGLSLPSEAQWEYAARGGTRTAFSFGEDCNASNCDPCATADDFMWWCGNSGRTTHPVGEKLPNPFGLHDMHGNVGEWCEDVYSTSFFGNPAATGPDPVSTLGSGLRVYRGGCWLNGAGFCRSAFRVRILPSSRSIIIGFRPLRPLP